MISTSFTMGQRVSSHNYHSAQNLPLLPGGIARDVLATMFLPNGGSVSIQLMGYSDATAIKDVIDASRNTAQFQGKNFALGRSVEEIEENIQNGFILGMVRNDAELMTVMGAETLDSEKSSGRGQPFTGCAIDKQILFGKAVPHPAMAGQNTLKLMAPYRMGKAIELYSEKTCFFTKANNPATKKTYGPAGLNWDLAAVYDLKNEVEIPLEGYDPETGNQDEDILHTYTICQRRLVKTLARENQDMFARSALLQSVYARYKTQPNPAVAVPQFA